ncbi:uncharacterized protein BXIN_0567 [Babesia sp. Xinjiang]|uniref:uncharacterized protein n=1 Tax=Babesia sp. Xinjiang TaxID=462227 RepID=UPI000A22613F|nr:uncharacterized protein BXIN_0567 [Babesia sp. Xinjiang]ORM41864.1 hypothetical protein BXIN_0567 [Babesia sp. Xinjiang]
MSTTGLDETHPTDLGVSMPKDEEASPSNDVVYRHKFRIFILMAILECFVNFDVGAMTVMLPWIQEPYSLSTTDLGLIGALPYVGLITLSPFIGIIFTFFKARWVIVTGLIGNILSLSLFAVAYNKAMFCVGRFLVGATQSFFIVYAPVWIGCFAPEVHKNLWMAILQGSIVGGFMVGYLVTAISGSLGESGWRYSIASQMGIIAILVYAFLLMPSEYINLSHTMEPDEESAECTTSSWLLSPRESSENGSVAGEQRDGSIVGLDSSSKVRIDVQHRRGSSCESKSIRDSITRSYCYHTAAVPNLTTCLKTKKLDIMSLPSIKKNASYYEWRRSSHIIVRNIPESAEGSDVVYTLVSSFMKILSDPYFCCSTLSISTLFYILTAIQFWTTKVSVSVYAVNPTLIYTLFIVTSITAPVIGVIAGSWVIDKIGMRYPTKPVIVDLVILSWTLIAIVSGVSAILWFNFYNLVACIWVILFFGGGMLPPLTLITIDNVPERLKPLASSICMCLYHIFGYIGGTMVPGVVMDITKDDAYAIYATYIPAILGALGAVGNVLARYRDSRKNPNQNVSETV